MLDTTLGIYVPEDGGPPTAILNHGDRVTIHRVGEPSVILEYVIGRGPTHAHRIEAGRREHCLHCDPPSGRPRAEVVLDRVMRPPVSLPIPGPWPSAAEEPTAIIVHHSRGLWRRAWRAISRWAWRVGG